MDCSRHDIQNHIAEKSLTEFKVSHDFVFSSPEAEKTWNDRENNDRQLESWEYKFYLHPALTVYTEVSHRIVEWTLATIFRDKMLNTVSRTILNVVPSGYTETSLVMKFFWNTCRNGEFEDTLKREK